jgi:hypothetical protein
MSGFESLLEFNLQVNSFRICSQKYLVFVCNSKIEFEFEAKKKSCNERVRGEEVCAKMYRLGLAINKKFITREKLIATFTPTSRVCMNDVCLSLSIT